MTDPELHHGDPYVGPRAFREGERLYGRDREARELCNLLIAERIVLLVAPSGAGKTSLIRAALTKSLVRRKFHVFPVARVGAEPLDAAALPAPPNRYLLSALQGLDAQTPLAELASGTFAEHLRRLAGPAESRVLVLDQFEEILTADPSAVAQKEAFFDQVGAALTDRSLWALFSMREEYMAALDPYLDRLPTRLATTYRLDLLGPEQAADAIRKPARDEGVDFTEDAAPKLIDDLRRMRVQRLDGRIDEVPGPHVEPVQLQVVCRMLWQRKRADPSRITLEDVRALGSLDRVLQVYYDGEVAKAAAAGEATERQIRREIGARFITKQRLRAQVLRDSAALPDPSVTSLRDGYLLRADERHGATWYELAHDRLVDPILTSNDSWTKAHLQPFQQQAVLWSESGRGPAMLFEGEALEKAEEWAEKNAAELSPEDRDFLRASRAAADSAKSQQTAKVRGRVIGVLAVFVLVVFGFAVTLSGKNKELETANGELSNAKGQLEDQARTLKEQTRTLKENGEKLEKQKKELAQTNGEITQQRDLAKQGAMLVLAYKKLGKVVEQAKPDRDRATEKERAGFEALLQGRILEAATPYAEACRADCLYFNVHEVYYELLPQVMNEYLMAEIEGKPVERVQRQALEEYREKYLGGLGPEPTGRRVEQVNQALAKLPSIGADGGAPP